MQRLTRTQLDDHRTKRRGALSEDEIAQRWVSEGGDPKYAAMMAKIAMRESGGRVGINNRGLNKNGTVDWGLYQVNDVWRKDPVIGPMFKSGEILTASGATKAAIRILKVQGPKAWATYNAATDAKYLGAFKGGATNTTDRVTKGTAPQIKQGGTTVDRRGAMLAALTDSRKGMSLLERYHSQVSTGAYTTTTKPTVTAGKSPKYQSVAGSAGTGKSSGGTTTVDGKPVKAWLAEAVAYARANGWTGKVTSGVRTKSQQMSAAKGFGLQHYGPAGPLGSNHVEGHDGAVDVSDPDGFERALRGYKGRKPKRAMADDPVHFSASGH